MAPRRRDIIIADILDLGYEYVECFANRPLGMQDEIAARLLNAMMEKLKEYDPARFWGAWNDGMGETR